MAKEPIQNLLGWLADFDIQGEINGNEFKTLCPFHEDTEPSLSINIEKQYYNCFSCEAKGDIYSFLAAATKSTRAAVYKMISGPPKSSNKSGDTLDQAAIIDWNRKLKQSGAWCKKLEGKGLNLQTIEKYLLGFDGERITIPIQDELGNIINARRYLPNARRNKMLSIQGHGSATLYPVSELKYDDILIVEGECKALLLLQMGYHAISPTGGASTWKTQWNSLFTDKRVSIIYDIDQAGKVNAHKVAQNLFPYAQSVKIIALPIKEEEYKKGDITNYIVDLQNTKEDLDNVLKSAPEYEISLPGEAIADDKVYHLHLSKTSQAEFSGKLVETKVLVSAKDTAPYLIPKKFIVRCDKDCDVCVFCNVFSRSEDLPEIEIDAKNESILELINTHKTHLQPVLKRAAGIPSACKKCGMKIIEKQNVEEIRIIPELEVETLENQQVVRKAYYVGHGIQTNMSYMLRCRVVPEPATQYATLLIYEAVPSVDSLSSFQLKDESREELNIFKPTEWTLEGIENKFNSLYADLESNITRIYRRRDLHTFYDLIYHSVLYIPFQGKVIKGWAEGMVIGDSGQGKSETVKMMQTHYGLGDKIDSKGATAAGLLGGLQETGNRWFVTWGVIPLNDKRLVVLEEVKGMLPDVISKLTDMRSSGVAEISRIQHAKTNARTRLIWITNPRSDIPIMQYNFGVQAITQIMGSLEDIRRFDMAMTVASGEVEKEWLNLSERDRPQIPHIYTSELCRNLLLWGWSRKANDVIVSPEATDEILKTAISQGGKYCSQIPLVEAADHRLKLARLATACAVRTFSIDENDRVIVRKCHVEFVAKFLDGIYASRSNGYAEFSRIQNRQNTISFNEKEVNQQLISMPHAVELATALLESQMFLGVDIEDWTGADRDQAKEFIGYLVRGSAIRRGRKAYTKTLPFIEYLKAGLESGSFSNLTATDIAAKEEF